MEKLGEIYYKLSECEYDELYDLISKLEGYLKTENIVHYDEIFKQIYNIIEGEEWWEY